MSDTNTAGGNVESTQAQHRAEDFAIAHCLPRARPEFIPSPVASSSRAQPWQIKIHNDTGTADFKYCTLVNGPCTLFTADISGHTITGGDTESWISAKYNTMTGEMTVISGALYTDVTDQTPPADPEFVKRLLYKLSRSAADKPWRVAVDYRSLGLIIYL